MSQPQPDRDDFERWLDSRPEDDEPLTDEEREALAESAADIAAGRTVSFDEIKAINAATADLPPDHAFTDAAAAGLAAGDRPLMLRGECSRTDPVAWMLDHAPLDDEPETDEERHAIAEARADRERGIKPVPFEDVLAESMRIDERQSQDREGAPRRDPV
jgi:hypothetical protein